MISVCVVDDHEVVRRGIRQILSETPDIRVVDEAASGEELLKKLAVKRFDVILLDISMPGRGGLEALKEVKARIPKLPVLMLTMHSEDQYAVRAIKLGADGYLTKELVSDSLAAAIRKLVSGGKYITPSLAEGLVDELGAGRSALPHESLSDREYQVFGMLARGKSVTGIAKELGLSAKTISTNRARLLAKMGLHNNAEIVYYAIQHRLVPLPHNL
ncbi:MAG: response regulator transcription factor [Elusimicrobiota bacterium]|jgi:DNA-binding NarL/FixJ family response regulator